MAKCFCGKCNFEELTKYGKPYMCPICKSQNTIYDKLYDSSNCLCEDIICSDCGHGT